MRNTLTSKMYKWESLVRDIDKREMVVLRDVSRMPVERGDFISQNMVIILNTEGSAKVLYDMQGYELKQWNIAVVYPNHMLAPVEVSNDYNAILLVISPALYEEMTRRTLSHDCIKFHTNPQYALTHEQALAVMKILDVIEIISDADRKRMPHRHELLGYMFDVLFETTASFVVHEEKKSTRMNRNQKLFSTFCEMLAQNYKEHKKMTWYAKQMDLTPKYFSAQIMDVIGKSAADWIQEWLIIRAKQLLDTRWDMNIQEVSRSLGFLEQGAFTRYFRRGTGMSPRQWRERDNAAQTARV